jgi:hypothetical protein
VLLTGTPRNLKGDGTGGLVRSDLDASQATQDFSKARLTSVPDALGTTSDEVATTLAKIWPMLLAHLDSKLVVSSELQNTVRAHVNDAEKDSEELNVKTALHRRTPHTTFN